MARATVGHSTRSGTVSGGGTVDMQQDSGALNDSQIANASVSRQVPRFRPNWHPLYICMAASLIASSLAAMIVKRTMPKAKTPTMHKWCMVQKLLGNFPQSMTRPLA